MNYKLFDEFITLQALFKELGIIQSGGAIKAFLLENQVEVNGEVETRRGRKLRVGDTIEVIGDKEIVTITQPSPEEIEDYQADKLEKERVAQLVKKLNKEQKQKKRHKTKKRGEQTETRSFPRDIICGLNPYTFRNFEIIKK